VGILSLKYAAFSAFYKYVYYILHNTSPLCLYHMTLSISLVVYYKTVRIAGVFVRPSVFSVTYVVCNVRTFDKQTFCTCRLVVIIQV